MLLPMAKDTRWNDLPPAVLVIFGATGDLFAKKVVPTLHLLHSTRRLPERFHVVGFGRRGLTDRDFRNHVVSIVRAASRGAPSRAFTDLFSYVHGVFDDDASFETLRRSLGDIDEGWGGCSVKMFYLAVPPGLFPGLLDRLSASGLSRGCGPDGAPARILIEKPFGSDSRTAKKLNAYLGGLFPESGIYRIDHYLAKRVLRELPALRARTPVLEAMLDRRHVRSIRLRLLESVGVEDRGAFYDKVGAFRDVGQNHLLEMLALVCMDLPDPVSCRALRAARTAFLAKLPRLPGGQIGLRTVRAQYRGYRDIAGVSPGSETETYFRVEASLSLPRFAGVPFVIESGKRLGKPGKGIEIALRGGRPGRILIELEPRERVRIERVGRTPFVRNLLSHPPRRRGRYAAEYAELLLDALRGDHTWFLSRRESEVLWRFADPIVAGWRRGLAPLLSYDPDTRAPERARQVSSKRTIPERGRNA